MVKLKFFDKFLKSNNSKSSNKTISKSNTNENLLDYNELINENEKSSILFEIINENFTCNCCLEILKDPITLQCGHTFCQLCLANWYITSSNKKCPTCRQEWQGVPKVNNLLKTVIKKLIKYEITQPNLDENFVALNSYIKKCDKLTENDKDLIKKFEEKCKSSPSFSFLNSTLNFQNPINANNNQNVNIRTQFDDLRSMTRRTIDYACYFIFGLIFGILIGFFIFGLIWLIASSQSITKDEINNMNFNIATLRKKYSKPTEKWSVTETQEWFYQLGPWTSDFVNLAHNLKIDGKFLLELNDTVLVKEPFNINDEQTRKLLLDSIKILKKCHLKTIDFWEFKNRNKFEVVLFSLFFESFPRLTLLYYYTNDYDESFKLLTKYSDKYVFDLNENDLVNIEILKKYFLADDKQFNDKRDQSSKLINVKKLSNFLFESPETQNRKISITATTTTSTIMSNNPELGYLLKFPYINLKNLFSIFFYDTNKTTCIFISINCLVLTLIDLVITLDFIRSLIGYDKERLKYLSINLISENLKYLFYITLVYQLWGLIPNIVIDFFFIGFLYVKVFFNINLFINYMKSFLESIAHYFIRPNY